MDLQREAQPLKERKKRKTKQNRARACLRQNCKLVEVKMGKKGEFEKGVTPE